MIKTKPKRTPGLLLARDAAYWTGLYQLRQRQDSDVASFDRPAATVNLMRRLAPDFEFDAQLSDHQTLIFSKTGRNSVKWTILFEKMGTLFDYPPSLILTAALEGKRKTFTADDIMFVDVIGSRRLTLYDLRDMELSLLFTLQRYRRAMDFYNPMVERTLHEETLK